MITASESVRQVGREDPGRVALRLPGGELTYAELDALADRLAAGLQARFPRGSRVALQAHATRTVTQVALGVNRAGMALVPLDPTAPTSRVDAMLLDSGAVVLLVEDVPVDLPTACSTLTVPDVLGPAGSRAAGDPLPPDASHLLSYTSGSTGVPKAVVVGETTSGAAALATYLTEMFPPSDRAWVVLSAGSLGASLVPVLIGLSQGRVVVPLEVRTVGLAPLADMLGETRAELLLLVPTVLRFWLPMLPTGRTFPDLRAVCLFGEAMTGDDHDALAAHLPSATTVFNVLATSEAGAVALHALPAGTSAGPGPLLMVVSDAVDVTITDEAGEPAPTGTSGEIVVTGTGTAHGYWNRPELTRSTFELLADGRRRVRTGDRGVLDDAGRLLHQGRLDHVVKVTGNRVDLGDVEHALRSLPAVVDAAVAARADAQGSTTLHAFVVARAGTPLHPVVLRTELARRVPPWMVPTTLTLVDELPRLPNGKVDRRTLPEPAAVRSRPGGRAPSSREVEILELWRAVLPGTDPGLDDDFFDLGGDSMRAATVIAHLARRHGKPWPVTLMMEATTPAQLAAVLDAGVADDVLVPVRVEGQEAPLFLVHGAAGSAFYAHYMVASLDLDCPVHAIRLPDPGPSGRLRETSLAELAARYVQAVARVHPDGPVRLFGYSVGGLIAYEMTVQLEAAGRRVELLGLGDSALHPQTRPALAPEVRGAAAQARALLADLRSADVRAAGHRLGRLARNQSRHRVALLRQRVVPAQPSSLVPVLRDPSPPGGSAQAAVQAELDARTAQAYAHTRDMLQAYRPVELVRAPALLVRAGTQFGPGDLGWSRLAPDLRVVTLDCLHDELIREPHLTEISRLLVTRLGAARAGA